MYWLKKVEQQVKDIVRVLSVKDKDGRGTLWPQQIKRHREEYFQNLTNRKGKRVLWNR